MRSWWSAQRLARSLRRALRERRGLQERPWEEELLHWAKDNSLHGHFSPPPDGRRRSTTRDGWCPAWAREVQRKYLPSGGFEVED
jgi:hypothetical protein